ncbi:MAG: sugar phosphate isomerase/epimerase [Tannerella sp.]|jgi:sugar phosphate isomerase/epimerase|nr:sugar phosphate isomerase/epimerase [Tannerella sp.]
MERRNFFKTLGATGVAVALCHELPAMESSAKKLPAIGLIPGNTGGEWFKQSPQTALKKIAALGYKELEFGGDLGLGTTAADTKKYLNFLGLKPLIGSTSMAAMNDAGKLKSDIRNCQELGQKYIACYWPWTDDGQNKQLDDWKKVADNLNKGGEICQKEGLQLLYHNHDIEFKVTEGQIPFDTLMARLHPKAVGIEFDLYWITKGGQSAVEYIKKYPGRYLVYHVKDMNPADRSFACVGSGHINFAEIFGLNKTAGVKHFIVEHDKPENPEECVASSAHYLLNLVF